MVHLIIRALHYAKLVAVSSPSTMSAFTHIQRLAVIACIVLFACHGECRPLAREAGGLDQQKAGRGYSKFRHASPNSAHPPTFQSEGIASRQGHRRSVSSNNGPHYYHDAPMSRPHVRTTAATAYTPHINHPGRLNTPKQHVTEPKKDFQLTEMHAWVADASASTDASGVSKPSDFADEVTVSPDPPEATFVQHDNGKNEHGSVVGVSGKPSVLCCRLRMYRVKFFPVPLNNSK